MGALGRVEGKGATLSVGRILAEVRRSDDVVADDGALFRHVLFLLKHGWAEETKTRPGQIAQVPRSEHGPAGGEPRL